MKELIEFFTQGGAEVLDCLAGVGGTLIGCAIAVPPRRGVGIEINARWIEMYRQVVQLEGLVEQEMLHGDCLAVMRGLDDERFDFIALDPPYGIHLKQMMARTGYEGAFANRRTDYNMRSQEKRDLANLASYADYLAAMGEIFQELYRLLKPGKYMVFIVRDAYQNGEMVLVHADLANAARRLSLRPEIRPHLVSGRNEAEALRLPLRIRAQYRTPAYRHPTEARPQAGKSRTARIGSGNLLSFHLLKRAR